MAKVTEITINREVFDHKDSVSYSYRAPEGLSEEVIRKISKSKNEPDWMLSKRLLAFEYFKKTQMPSWGVDLSGLDLDKITYFLEPNAKKNSRRWEDVPEEIKKTFERLGIPQAEREALAGVGGQYDSNVVYHNLKKEWEDKGIIFLDMDEALQKYPELVKEYFMTKCIPINDHRFIMLHAAVWSGGTFIYVPKNVKVDLPLQAYFRMNAEKMGQFEHTLIIADEGSEVHYIEGCFTKDNIVSTNPDYKPIETIKKGDKVLSHNGKYSFVDSVQIRSYSGDIYAISVRGDPTTKIEVTGEHPFLYVDKKRENDRNKVFNKRWNIPKFFRKGDYLAMPINKVVKENDFYEYEIEVFDNKKKVFAKEKIKLPSNKEFFKLLGYYLSEGSISSEYYVNFSFGEHERNMINEVKSLLSKVFGDISMHESNHKENHGTNVVVSSVRLARTFKNFGRGCNNKVVPQWAMLEHPEKQKELLKGMFFGDGNYYNQRCKSGLKEVFRFSTVSEKLARQIRDLLLRQGIVSFINKRNRSKENRRTMYIVGITGEYVKRFGDLIGIPIRNKVNGKNRASMFGIDEEFAYFPIKSVEKTKVENIPVYNFSVEGTQTYCVNGFAVHNCSAPQYNVNSIHAGCVEIYVKRGAKVRYSSIENWSKNTYNLNTKRAVVEEDGIIEWVSGNMGSGFTMLYPCSILKGKNSKADHISIAFAGRGQNQDTGAKVFHLASNTSSTIRAKSISADGGITSYRGLVKINKGAVGAKAKVVCDALMFGEESVSDTYPTIDVKEKEAVVSHEASVGKISEEQLFYLKSRGLSEEQAIKLLVNGFIEPIVKSLPLEYAVELNRLIELEMEGAVG